MPQNLQGIGNPGITYGPVVVDYGPKGMTTHFTAQCLTIGPLIGYYNYIVTLGASGRFMGTDLGNDGITSAEDKKLEVSIPGLWTALGRYLSELFFDSWEILTNEPTDSIFDNPLIVGTSGWMTPNDKDVLSYLALNGGTPANAASQADLLVPANFPHTAITGASDPRSLQIQLEIQKGQVEYAKPAYVLRHTSYCSQNAYYNTATSGTEQIYTTAQLLSEVGSGWTYNLPGRLYSKIASIPVQFAPADEAAFYRWGWKKTISREVVQSNFVVEVETEYALALWSTLRYQTH